MWSDGFTASQISEALGGVSRNAVIGKAYRLGLRPHRSITSEMLSQVATLPLGNRTKSALYNDGVFFVGDLVQKTESELLRTPNFGRKSLNDVKSALAALNLDLGLFLPQWPPPEIEKLLLQWEAARRVSELHQARGGATFQAVDDHFVMTAGGDQDDLAAAQRPMTQQMHAAILQRARNFVDVASRLDNQPGWGGISRTTMNLVDLLDRPSISIPDVLGFLYPVAIELGSFIEFDQQLTAGAASYTEPLDPEVRRPLSDLVRNLAPWLRAFPSIRDADDEASRFLVKAGELQPTFDVIAAASEHDLLTDRDVEVFRQLRDAADRGVFQGEKAGGRAKRSASNFVIGVAAFAGTFFSGAASSDYATTSPLVHKVGQFLVRAEKSIEALVADLPQDLSHSIIDFIGNFPSQIPILPPSAPEVTIVQRGAFRSRDDL